MSQAAQTLTSKLGNNKPMTAHYEAIMGIKEERSEVLSRLNAVATHLEKEGYVALEFGGNTIAACYEAAKYFGVLEQYHTTLRQYGEIRATQVLNNLLTSELGLVTDRLAQCHLLELSCGVRVIWQTALYVAVSEDGYAYATSIQSVRELRQYMTYSEDDREGMSYVAYYPSRADVYYRALAHGSSEQYYSDGYEAMSEIKKVNHAYFLPA